MFFKKYKDQIDYLKARVNSLENEVNYFRRENEKLKKELNGEHIPGEICGNCLNGVIGIMSGAIYCGLECKCKDYYPKKKDGE